MICPKCGLRIPLDREPSYFDGRLIQLIGWEILAFLVTLITFGICYPWALCKLYGWRIKHTVINGRRLRFDGTAMQLFGNWIKWWVLSVITLGIYAWWLPIKVNQWTAKHTSIVDGVAPVNEDDRAYTAPAPAAPSPAYAASSVPRRVAPELPEGHADGRIITATIFAVLACVFLVVEIAALVINLWVSESAFIWLFPAWSVLAALGGAVLFGIIALIISGNA